MAEAPLPTALWSAGPPPALYVRIDTMAGLYRSLERLRNGFCLTVQCPKPLTPGTSLKVVVRLPDTLHVQADMMVVRQSPEGTYLIADTVDPRQLSSLPAMDGTIMVVGTGSPRRPT